VCSILAPWSIRYCTWKRNERTNNLLNIILKQKAPQNILIVRVTIKIYPEDFILYTGYLNFTFFIILITCTSFTRK
jgi:hypothetical protein